MPSTPKQVNVRVSREIYDVLDAAAFVRGFRGMQDLVGPVVEREAEKLAQQAPVQDALAARRKQASGNGKA